MTQTTFHPWKPRCGPRSGRRAALLVAVLVCLSVVMALGAAWLRGVLLEHRQVRAQADRLQAEYLAASAVNRATAQLAANPDYRGETYVVDAQTLALRADAAVNIRVEPVADDAQARRVVVEANFPDEGAERARRGRQVTISLAN
jgi:Tfp pilus assembly protein PilX